MELCTPTGAALLTSLAEAFGPAPAMTVEAIGTGAGRRDPRGWSNSLRVFLGERTDAPQPLPFASDRVVEFTAAVDDMTGEELGAALSRLLEADALDALAQPATMKKGRPGHVLTVLCRPADRVRIARRVFETTSTLGLRVREVDRYVLERETIRVPLDGAEVRVKIGRAGSEILAVAPEFDDCLRCSVDRGGPVAQYSARARSAALAALGLVGGDARASSPRASDPDNS